jgi:hypothetical protein
MKLSGVQKRMIGHGAVVMMIGMAAGTGLLISLLGGLELIPGSIIQFGIPGSSDAWVRAHIGGMMNGMLIMLVAVLAAALAVSDAVGSRLAWMLIGTGYANTLFYWAALLAPNRALSIADNRWGESNLASIIGLVPALVFVVIAFIAMFILMRQAFASAREA